MAFHHHENAEAADERSLQAVDSEAVNTAISEFVRSDAVATAVVQAVTDAVRTAVGSIDDQTKEDSTVSVEAPLSLPMQSAALHQVNGNEYGSLYLDSSAFQSAPMPGITQSPPSFHSAPFLDVSNSPGICSVSSLQPSPLLFQNPMISHLINASSASPLISPIETIFNEPFSVESEENTSKKRASTDVYSSTIPSLSKLEMEITLDSFDSTCSTPNSDCFEKSVSALAIICRNKLYKPMYRTQSHYGMTRWKLAATRLCQIVNCDGVLRVSS